MKTKNKKYNTSALSFLIAVFLFMFILENAVAQNNSVLIETVIKQNETFQKGKKIICKQFETQTSEQPILFKKEDRYKLNQDRRNIPQNITKIIMLDNDKDTDYEKKASLVYKRKGEELYNFNFTSKGLSVSSLHSQKTIMDIYKVVNNSFVETKLLDEAGLYKVIFTNGEKHLIDVKTYETFES